MAFRNSSLFLLLAMTLMCLTPGKLAAQCDPVTPTFTLDLSGAPNASSVTPVAARNGTCCGGLVPCVKIIVILHPNSMALELAPTGADPGGSLTYEFNCNGIKYPGGTRVCLSGTGPHTLTVCKVGNNPNSYSVNAIPRPNLPDSVMVRNGCTQTLATTGFSVPTIQWTSVPANTLHNSYLNCTSGCATVVVTPSGTPPAYVDYEVSGYAANPCGANFYRDTVRVFFYSDLNPFINPANPTICYGSTSAVLTASATGGKVPYTYSWTTGSTAQTVTVGVGTYSVKVFDGTGCPPGNATVQVNSFTLPIQAIAGADPTVCKNNPTVALSGSIVSASGGTWSAQSGTFLPSNAVLNATYIPTGSAVSSGSIEIILGSTGNAGCIPDQDTLVVFFQNQPTITAVSDQTVCANNNLSLLTANITGYTATALWSAPGGGTLSPPTGPITTFSPTGAQVAAGSATVFVNTTNNGACGADADTVVIFITPSPSVNAGPDQLICSNTGALLNGTVTMSAFTGSWSTAGDGAFSNGTSLSTSYTPGPSDISTGTVNIYLTSTNNGNCIPVKDSLKLTIAPIATVNATGISPICSNATSAALSATVAGAAGTGSWSTGGGGTFGNTNSLQTTYLLSSGDRTNTLLTFTITSTNNGPCPAVTSAVNISVTPLATVFAGSNQIICSTQSVVLLGTGQPTISGGTTTGTWSASGSGAFNQGSGYATSDYTISPADIAAGTITYTLTSTANGICPPQSDTVQIRVISSPTVLAVPHQTLCSTSGMVPLSGTITGAISNNGLWLSSGTGSFSPSSSSLSTGYVLTGNDITNGVATFTLTSSNNGPCAAQQATTQANIVTPATVIPGNNQLICSTQLTVQLSGTVTGASGTGAWVSDGSGTFTQPNAAATIYSISQNDINVGIVQFTLISTGNGPCVQDQGSMQLQIMTQPTVLTGPSSTLCETSPTANISGTITGGSGSAIWSTSGDGTFLPSTSAPSANYVLGASDLTNGQAILTFSSTNNAPCPDHSATLSISVNYTAQVDAGQPQLICSSQGSIALNGTVTSAAGTGTWVASGSGNFVPNNSPVTGYVLTPADIAAGSVDFSLFSTNNGACAPVSATTQVQIAQQPSVMVSASQTLCSTSNSAVLNSTVSSAGATWSTSGSGQFSPSASAPNPDYIFSTADVNNGTILIMLNSNGNSPCAETADSLLLNVQSPAIANAGTYQPICSSSNSVSLAGTVTGGLLTGQWTSSGSGTFVPSSTDLNAHYVFSPADATAGAITFSLTTTNNGACNASLNTATLGVIHQASVLAAADQSICSNKSSIALQATVSGSSPGLQWSTGGTGVIANPSQPNTTYSISPADIAAQKVKFSITVASNAPCSAVADSMNLSITPRPVVTLKSDTSICANAGPLNLTSQIANGSGKVLWISTGTGTFVPTNFLPEVAYLLSPADAVTGTVLISLNSVENGACGEVSSSMMVDIRPSPIAGFSASQYSVTLPADPVIFTNQTKGGTSYAWQVSDGTQATTFNFVKDFTSVGYYTVTLAAENDDNCSDTIRKVITVISTVKYPNAFTPNGDKLNDVFRLYTDGVVEFELNIYNRWGERIFRSENLRDGWDGSFNGKACQQDVYVWTANILFFDGRKFEDKGTVTLLK